LPSGGAYNKDNHGLAVFLGSRLFSPRAFSIGGAAWRVLLEGKNQPFAMPVWDCQKFLKKPLASGRVFDIFFAPLRPKDGTDSMIADR